MIANVSSRLLYLIFNRLLHWLTLLGTLGISTNSAVQWAKRSKRDWHAFVGARSCAHSP
jgi:hypothetical protein